MKSRLILSLILIGGCMSPSTSPEDIHQRAAILVAMLIDSNYIHHSYLEVLEIVSNDSNVIYRVRPSDSAASCTDELPSRVLSYKDKYLCFIELDEQEMSRNELFEKGIVTDSNFQSNSLDFDDGFWLLALQKYGKEHVLVKYREEYDNIVEMPELWPYLSGGSPQSQPVFMSMDKHYIVVADSLLSRLGDLGVDTLKRYINRFYGVIQLKNQTDSTIVLSNNNLSNLSFALVNKTDTLKLVLRGSLPIILGSHEYAYLRYDSESPQRFLQNLPEQDVWMSMYRLFSDSTFCFLKMNGIPTNFRILHNDATIFSYITVDSETQKYIPGDKSKIFYNNKVHDKDLRGYRFRGW